MTQDSNGTKGFTISEVIVSVAIVALLSAIVIANFKRGSYSDDLRHSSQLLMGNLRRMQNLAMIGQAVSNTVPKGGYGVFIPFYATPAPASQQTPLYILFADVFRDFSPCRQLTDADLPDSSYDCADYPVEGGYVGLKPGVVINRIKVGSTFLTPSVDTGNPTKVDIGFRPPKPIPVVDGVTGETIAIELQQTKTSTYRTVTIIGPSGQINEQPGAIP
ncbi:MAG: type II secretion system protein [Candidatus Kerfeldbacteria bacterium]|nr:type II secretion system protein [Candidatus Kerfeldbacteria bacterium]